MHEHVVVESAHLQHLLDALAARGYQVVGPTVRDSAIVYEAIDSVDALPMGWTDEHDGGGVINLRNAMTWRGSAMSSAPTPGKNFCTLPNCAYGRRSAKITDFNFSMRARIFPSMRFLGSVLVRSTPLRPKTRSSCTEPIPMRPMPHAVRKCLRSR